MLPVLAPRLSCQEGSLGQGDSDLIRKNSMKPCDEVRKEVKEVMQKQWKKIQKTQQENNWSFSNWLVILNF